MSEEEFALFCAAARSALEAINTQSKGSTSACVGAGLQARFTGDGEVATCEAARDACVESGEGPHGSTAGELVELPTCDEDEEGAVVLGPCAMTVLEFETCTGAIVDLMAVVEGALSCEMSMAEAAELEMTTSAPFPEECEPVQAACPSLFIAAPITP